MISSNTNVDKTYDIEVEVTNLMHEVGIPPHMAGYQYLREAIIQTVLNAKAFTSITKTLYPKVAKKFNTTSQKVERAIRNAIESAWAREIPIQWTRCSDIHLAPAKESLQILSVLQ